MTELYLSSAAFIAAHLVPTYLPLRQALVRLLGERLYIALFIILSIGLSIWLAVAFIQAPYVEVWQQSEWHRWASLLIMPLSCLLGFIGLTSYNPFSFGLGFKQYDPARPGVVRLTRHPVIWAMALWSAAHIVTNGDEAGITLFAMMLALSALGANSMRRRRKAALGPEHWQQLQQTSGSTPLTTALMQIKLWQWLGGIVLFGGLIALHEIVIGVSPLPGELI